MDLTRLREIARGRRPAVPGDAAAEEPATPSVQARGADEPAVGRRELAYEYVDRAASGHLPAADPDAWRQLEGSREVATPLGPCVVVDHVFEAEQFHGPARVADHAVSSDASLATLGRWGDRWASPDGRRPLEAACADPTRRIVFLDLETTGLSGGAGTVAFLVGCGYFEDGAFKTLQFFLTNFSRERAMLHAVSELLASAACLVTYNGKSFDVPVMETRWLFQRMAVPIDTVPHLDMLHLARRFWRSDDEGDVQSCRLVALERTLLGVHRVNDVHGFEVPGRYFDYVRGGHASLLEPVLLHNRLDLLSLAALTARAQRLIRDGIDASVDPREWFAVGLLYECEGRAEAAACFSRVASSPMTSTPLRVDAWRRLARGYRRARRFEEAASAWQEVLELAPSGGAAAEAREALAVHFEHRRRDLAEAKRLAIQSLQVASTPSRRDASSHRVARLTRKLDRSRTDDARPQSLLD